jgi:hypothetical protein
MTPSKQLRHPYFPITSYLLPFFPFAPFLRLFTERESTKLTFELIMFIYD